VELIRLAKNPNCKTETIVTVIN